MDKPAGSRLRRRIGLMLQNTTLVGLSAALLATGLAVVAYFVATQPSNLTIAVGPPGSNDVRLVQSIAQYLARERAPVRLKPMVKNGPVEAAAAMDAGEADLAVVRRDLPMPRQGQAIAILRKNYAVLFAKAVPEPEEAETPAAAKGKKDAKTKKDAKGKNKAKEAKSKSASKAKKNSKKSGEEEDEEDETSKKKSKGIEKIEDLVGRRIGVVGKTQANINLLNAILDQYQIPRDKVAVVQFDTNDVASIRDSKVDVVLAVGPLNSRITADAINAASAGKTGPTFLALGASDALAQRAPAYESAEIPTGAFGGSPPRPDDTVETVSFSHFIVARKTLYDSAAAALVKHLLASRQGLASENPDVSKIEAPDTDKTAVVAVHPGAAAYIDGEEKTLLDRYGDLLYWGLMLCSFIGSAAAGVMSYSKVGEAERIQSMLDRSLEIVSLARTATETAVLDALRKEVDDIQSAILRDAEKSGMSDTMLTTFSIAGDRALAAIAERRDELAERI